MKKINATMPTVTFAAPGGSVIAPCSDYCTCNNHWGHCVTHGLSKKPSVTVIEK